MVLRDSTDQTTTTVSVDLAFADIASLSNSATWWGGPQPRHGSQQGA